MILNKEYIQLILLAIAIFSSCWPICRNMNGHYWIFATPYILTFLGLCVQHEMIWQKFFETIQMSLVFFLLPFPFHLIAILVKRFHLKV
jgi:hypothetical protein